MYPREDAGRIKHLPLAPLTLHCDANLGQLYEYGAVPPDARTFCLTAPLQINLNNTADRQGAR